MDQIDLKRRQLELLQEKLRLKEENPLAFYQPHAKQDSFHRNANFVRRMYRSGNRSGKSWMGCSEDLAYCIGYRPWYPKSDPARTVGIPQRPLKGLVITTDWDKVDEIFTSQRGKGGKLWQFMPKGAWKGIGKNPTGVINRVEFHSGSLLQFDTVQSFKHNPQGSESSDWDFIHVDEPCPEDMWKAASRGLIDRNGSAWFTLTPLAEMWINEMFFPRFDDVRSALWKNTHWAVFGSIYDNTYLTPEAISLYEASLSEEEKECRLFGTPLELTGLVYKEFNWAYHVLKSVPEGWENFNSPPLNWPIYITVDPHLSTPQCALLMTVDPFGRMYVYDELWYKGTIHETAMQLKVKTANRRVMSMKIDPFACIKDPISDTTIIEEYGKHDLWMEKASKDKARGIMCVKQALRDKNIFFVPNIKRTLWEMTRYCYDKENSPIDKDDHTMECLYRLVIDEPSWIPPESDKRIVIPEIDIRYPDIY